MRFVALRFVALRFVALGFAANRFGIPGVAPGQPPVRTMSDDTLYDWSAPFRGQFVHAVLAWAGRRWTDAGDDKVSALMEGPVKTLPVPVVGPPGLVDG